jgi:hypothetical protein
VVQIVALASALSDASEDGETTVGLGDVVLSLLDVLNASRRTYDQFLDEHGLADTSTSEETNLSTTSVRSEKVDDLDARNQDLGRGGLLNEFRRIGMNGALVLALNRATLVNGVAGDVHDATEGRLSDRNHDGASGVDGGNAADETFGTCRLIRIARGCYICTLTVHGNASHDVFAQMLLQRLAEAWRSMPASYSNLQHESVATIVRL